MVQVFMLKGCLMLCSARRDAGTKQHELRVNDGSPNKPPWSEKHSSKGIY
jgi:hypothetical protein